jgi:hypothetical protein
MEITIYRRHIKQCSKKNDRYAPRCGCPLSGSLSARRGWYCAELALFGVCRHGSPLRPSSSMRIGTFASGPMAGYQTSRLGTSFGGCRLPYWR